MISGTQQPENRIDARHPRGENVSAMPSFQLGHGALERFAVRMIRSRVVVTFVLAQFFVYIRRSLIDRRDDRAGGRIRLLPHMNGIGCKTHDALLALSRTFVTQAS